MILRNSKFGVLAAHLAKVNFKKNKEEEEEEERKNKMNHIKNTSWCYPPLRYFTTKLPKMRADIREESMNRERDRIGASHC